MFCGLIVHRPILFTSHKADLRNNRAIILVSTRLLCHSSVILVAVLVIIIVMIISISISTLRKLAVVRMLTRFSIKMTMSLFLLIILSRTKLETIVVVREFLRGLRMIRSFRFSSHMLKLENSTDFLLYWRFCSSILMWA